MLSPGFFTDGLLFYGITRDTIHISRTGDSRMGRSNRDYQPKGGSEKLLGGHSRGCPRRTWQARLLVDTDPQGHSTSGVGIAKKKCPHLRLSLLIECAPPKGRLATAWRGVEIIQQASTGGAEIELVNCRGIFRLRPHCSRQAVVRLPAHRLPAPLGLTYVNACVLAIRFLFPSSANTTRLRGSAAHGDVRRSSACTTALDIGGACLTMLTGV